MLDLSRANVSLPYNDLNQLILDRNSAVTAADAYRTELAQVKSDLTNEQQKNSDLTSQLMESNQKVVKLEASLSMVAPESGSVKPTG